MKGLLKKSLALVLAILMTIGLLGFKELGIITQASSGELYGISELPETIPNYPSEGQKYWVIFNEGLRNDRLEMSTFDVSGDESDVRIIWNRNLCAVSSTGTVSSSNQFSYTTNEWRMDRTYSILSDKATNIFASNVDVYDSAGNKVIDALDWSEIRKEEIQTNPSDDIKLVPNLGARDENKEPIWTSDNPCPTVIDRNRGYIYGLTERSKELEKYITVQGNGHIETVAVDENFGSYKGTKTIVNVYNNETNEIVESFYVVIFGDVNGDSHIASTDKYIVEQEALGNTKWSLNFEGNEEYDPVKVFASDLNHNGIIDSEDALLIYNHVVGIVEIDQKTGNVIGEPDNPGSGGENPELESGLSVFTNNTSFAYVEGDLIFLAVSQIENNEFFVPEKLAVAISNDSVIELNNIYTYNDLLSINIPILKPIIDIIPEEFRNCSFVLMKANGEGTSSVTLSNSSSGDSTNLFLTVSKDEYATLRAENVPVRYDRGVSYNYFINGTVISDFTYSKAPDGYIFKMNAYNQQYSLGVVEVFNSDGKIIKVEKIDKFEAAGTSIVKTFKSGWYLIEDAWNGELMTFKARQIAKQTEIEVLVPEGGFVRISNDSAASTTCFLTNLFDAVLTAGGIIKGTSSLSVSQVDLVTKTAVAKFITDTYYLETAKKFQEKMKKMVAKKVSEPIFISLVSQAAGIADELLIEVDISFEDIAKEALGTASGIGEEIFKKLTGPAGIALNVLFSSQKCLNYVSQMVDWCNTTDKQGFIGIVTPYNPSYDSGRITSADGIIVDTNNGVESETILQTFRILKDDVTINLDSQEIENDFVLYDISLVKDGNTVQPNKKVTVYVPLPSGFKEPITVLRQNSDGSWTIIDAKVLNKVIVFEVDHFCTFAFVSEMEIDKSIPALISIRTPSTTTINYGDSIILHADIDGTLPAGARVEWTADSGNFGMSVSADGLTCKISPKSSGKTVFSATVYDKDGNVISSDTQEMTAKAGLWQKIVAFFKKIFGLTKTIPEAFKGIF